MAILDFLKRKKTRDLEVATPPDLGLPELPELPDIESGSKENEFPELPDLPDIGKVKGDLLEPVKTPEVGKPVHDASDLSLPELPELPKETAKKIHRPIHKVIRQIPKERMERPMPVQRKIERPRHIESIVEREEAPVVSEIAANPVYLKAYDYHEVLDGVESIMNRLKRTEGVLKELNKIKDARDKEFEKYRDYLEDVQRKSLVIDQSLFKKG